MLPGFHRERIAASVDVMVKETTLALDQLTPAPRWTSMPGRAASPCASRCARSSASTRRRRRAFGRCRRLFEQALSFYSSEYALRMPPRLLHPWARMQQAARSLDRLIYSEISSRRASGERGEDILSLLLDAADETATSSPTCRFATR